MTSQFNVYDNIHSPKVENFTTIEQWFNLIKKSEYAGAIESARQIGKSDPIYNVIKKSIPAITYNFTFHTKKEDNNRVGATGLLYIDIDVPEFDINTLDKNLIFSYYKSFGGKGYAVLVRVEGLTKNNFNSTYNFICDNLGISSCYDKNAKKATQFNVLSYDANIFINYNSLIFESILTEDENINSQNVLSLIKEEEGETYKITLSTKNEKARYNNLDEIKFEGDYIVNWDGYKYIQCWLPPVKLGGDSNDYLLSFTTNFVHLNPTFDKRRVFNTLNKVANNVFIQLVSKEHLMRVVNSVFKYKEDGTLKPTYYWKLRKFLFNEDCNFTKDQKLAICRTELGQKKSAESKEKISNLIENWNSELNGKITVRKVVSIGKMGKNTVIKYWPEYKAIVEDLNKQIKADAAPIKKTEKKAKSAPLNKEKIKVEQVVAKVETQPIMALKEEFNMDKVHINKEAESPVKMNNEEKCIAALKAFKEKVAEHNKIYHPTEIVAPTALNEPVSVYKTEPLSGTTFNDVVVEINAPATAEPKEKKWYEYTDEIDEVEIEWKQTVERIKAWNISYN